MFKLIDTSAWIDFFKAKDPYAEWVDKALEEGSAAICGMIELELRQGIKAGETRVFKLLPALHQLQTLEQDFRDAGAALSQLRQKGISVPSSDGLIAQVAIREGVELIANDRHFEHFVAFGLRRAKQVTSR